MEMQKKGELQLKGEVQEKGREKRKRYTKESLREEKMRAKNDKTRDKRVCVCVRERKKR